MRHSTKRFAIAVGVPLTLLATTPVSAGHGDPAPRWQRFGLGMVTDLAAGDLDGDGQNELVVGGRGVGVVDETGPDDGRFAWANKWLGPDGEPMISDAETVSELALANLDADPAPDILAGSDRGLFAIEGGTGATKWFANDAAGDATNGGAHEVAAADMNGDGVADAAFAERLDDRITAVDGRDGTVLWQTPRPLAYVNDISAGDVNGDGFADVIVLGQAEAGAGFEVLALSGLGAAVSGVALPLWVQRFPAPGPADGLGGGSAGSAVIAQIQPGGLPEVAVAGGKGLALLDGLTGLPLARMSTGADTYANRVAAANLDGDPALEIAAAVIDLSGGDPASTIRAYDPDGTQRWSVPAPASVGDVAVADLDADGSAEIVAAGGWQKFGGKEDLDGFAMAVGGSGATLWTRGFPEAANALEARATLHGAVLLGHTGSLGDGGGLTALDADGETDWQLRSGGRIEDVAAADIDADGIPEVIEGADDAAVAVHDASGARLWERRVPGKGGPDVLAVAAGDLQPAPGLEVVAGTLEYAEGPVGRLHLYGATGARRWSLDVNGAVDALAVRDIDRDGADDLLVAAASGSIGDDRGVALRLDGDGDVVWERVVRTGTHTTLSVDDLDEDGIEDLILTKASVFHGGSVTALDGATGQELWVFELNRSVNWASVDPKLGVVTGDLAGVVYRLDGATGAVIWLADPGNASWGGGWTVDADGDGLRDLVSASHDNAARLLSGAGGEVLWTAPTDLNPGSTVATVRGGNGPVIAVGSFGQATYAPAEIMLLEPATGERLAHLDTYGPVLDLAATDLDADGDEEVLAAAGWQLVALDA